MSNPSCGAFRQASNERARVKRTRCRAYAIMGSARASLRAGAGGHVSRPEARTWARHCGIFHSIGCPTVCAIALHNDLSKSAEEICGHTNASCAQGSVCLTPGEWP
jgi:hypothetical protein